jgi:hypothetical protein
VEIKETKVPRSSLYVCLKEVAEESQDIEGVDEEWLVGRETEVMPTAG